MSWKAFWKNDRGLTLVEILAALVILGIVFVGFMTVFPQMTIFNEKTYSKLETMNLAKKELESIKTIGLPAECKEKTGICTVDGSNPSGYVVVIEYKMKPDLVPQSTAEGQVTLYQVHIKFMKTNQDEKIVSETFGYVEG